MDKNEEESRESEDMDLKAALECLDEGNIVTSVSDKRRTYFLLKGGKIIMVSGEVKAELSLADFRTLYANSVFGLYQGDDPIVDPQKDEEYYSWGNKM